jgi:hypothetical protein
VSGLRVNRNGWAVSDTVWENSRKNDKQKRQSPAKENWRNLIYGYDSNYCIGLIMLMVERKWPIQELGFFSVITIA